MVVNADNPSLVMSAILSLIGQLALLCRQIPDVVSCLSGCTASLRSLPRRRAVGQRHIIAERNQMHQTPPPFPRQVIMRFNGDRLFQNVHDCALRNKNYFKARLKSLKSIFLIRIRVSMCIFEFQCEYSIRPSG